MVCYHTQTHKYQHISRHDGCLRPGVLLLPIHGEYMFISLYPYYQNKARIGIGFDNKIVSHKDINVVFLLMTTFLFTVLYPKS